MCEAEERMRKMSRLILARHAARNCIIGSRIPKFPLYESYLPNPPPPQPTPPPSSTPRSRFFPQIPYLSNNLRFFSHQTVTDPTVTFETANDGSSSENDAVPLNNEIEGQVAEEEEEEETHEIDTEKLDAVLRLLQSNADGSLESSLDDMRLTLHQDFVARVIETPSVSGGNLIRFFNWARNDKSFKVTASVVETLVSAVCGGVLRKKEIYSLWDLVRDVGEKESGVLSVGILNELIASLSKLGKGKAALEVFDKFEAFEIVPNADSYYSTVEALCKRWAFDSAWSVCRKMIDSQSLPDDGEKVGNIVSWFCKGKKSREAHEVYMAAKEKSKHLPMNCVSFLVAILCQEDETVGLALEMLNDIPGERRKHAINPFLAVVRALCRVKDLDAAKKLVLEMIADGPPPGNAVFNFVITGYCKAGEMGQAVEIVKLLESRGLKPDLYAYAVLMSGYSNGGEMEEARKVLEEAKRKHSKLTPVMYHTLIRGYCKLEQFDKALELLTEMKDFGVSPNADEYEKLIQSLCLKALDWEKAEKLLEEMKENGLHLKGITRALIRAVKDMEKEVVEAGNSSSAA